MLQSIQFVDVTCCRFVGLLLVTKLLPQGSDAVVRQVLDALGTTFIDRLLLPLSRPHLVRL